MVAQLIDAIEAPDLSALLLKVSHAEMVERIHQSVCRQFKAGDPCASCDFYATAWATADRAFSAFLAQLADQHSAERAS